MLWNVRKTIGGAGAHATIFTSLSQVPTKTPGWSSALAAGAAKRITTPATAHVTASILRQASENALKDIGILL
jgi:hypothetical protein